MADEHGKTGKQSADQGPGQPPIEDLEDARVHKKDRRNHWGGGEESYPGGGVNGPIKQDKRDYKTLYGETTYGAGHKHDAPLAQGDPAVSDPARGLAGSRGVIPGAGADSGPPEPSASGTSPQSPALRSGRKGDSHD